MHRALLVASLLATSSACYTTDFVSEEEQLLFRTEGVSAGVYSNIVPSTSPVVAGTKLCATVCRNDDDTSCREEEMAFVASCFTSTVSGPARMEGNCITFDEPGEVRWQFEPVPCDGGEGLVSDGVSFDVVAPDAVSAHVVYPNEQLVSEMVEATVDETERVTTTAEGGGVPTDVVPADGDPVLWMVGGTSNVAVTLDRDGTRASWETAQARLDVRSDAEPDPLVTQTGSGQAVVTPEVEGTGDIAFVLDRSDWVAGRWEAVPQNAAASLEIVVVNTESEDASGPFAARAVIRDEQGLPIFGAPVDWGTADGNLGITLPAPDEGDASYVSFDTERCLQPSHREGDHTTTLQARFGKLYDEITVAWTLPPLEESDSELADADAAWQEPEFCLGPVAKPLAAGCGCATSEPAGALAAVVALISAAFRARRRPGS